MANINVRNSFSRLLEQAPHKDISAINKFILSGCFTKKTSEVYGFIKRMGYTCNNNVIKKHVELVKSQLAEVQNKFGPEVELEFFCDVAGTSFFNDFIHVYDKDSFYQEMISFNPDFKFTGDLANIKRRAFMAMKEKEFQHVGEGISVYLGALELALKKIGVNPEEEINGMSKSVIAMICIMRVIGGMQLYLPKGDIFNRVLNQVDMYVDSFRMEPQALARKYGVTFKTVITASKIVSGAIKEYEGKNEDK